MENAYVNNKNKKNKGPDWPLIFLKQVIALWHYEKSISIASKASKVRKANNQLIFLIIN